MPVGAFFLPRFEINWSVACASVVVVVVCTR